MNYLRIGASMPRFLQMDPAKVPVAEQAVANLLNGW